MTFNHMVDIFLHLVDLENFIKFAKWETGTIAFSFKEMVIFSWRMASTNSA